MSVGVRAESNHESVAQMKESVINNGHGLSNCQKVAIRATISGLAECDPRWCTIVSRQELQNKPIQQSLPRTKQPCECVEYELDRISAHVARHACIGAT